MRVVLQWQRLVRAGKVRAIRRVSPMWESAERHRRRRLSERYRSQTMVGGVWQSNGKRARGQMYSWCEQEAAVRRMGVTSGAAAVITQRREAATSSSVRARSPLPMRTSSITGESARAVHAC